MLAVCFLSAFLSACGHGATERNGRQEARQVSVQDGSVELLYFHGKRRCSTCRAVESEVRELVGTVFADEVADGRLRFRSLECSEERELAERYGAFWSSLLLVRHAGGEERVEDLTLFAFGKARTNPEAFRRELAERIVVMLE